MVPCVSLLACGGGGGGKGPTAPSPQPSLLVVDAALVSLSGGVEEGRLLYDGQEVFHSTCNPAGACQLAATLSGTSRGSHTVTIVVVRQNRSSLVYDVVGEVDYADAAGGKTVPLEQRHLTLHAGDTVVYNITI
jgi:hypothetical protein